MRGVRERDAIDYGLVGAVTLLAYPHLPFRPAVRGAASYHVGESPTTAAGLSVVVAVVGAGFVPGPVRHATR